MTAFHITTDLADSGRVVAVHGELDLATAPELRTALDGALAAGGDCMLSLGGCQFIDSSGTREILIAAERFRAAGAQLTLHCPTDNTRVRFVIDLLGLGDVMTVIPGGSSNA